MSAVFEEATIDATERQPRIRHISLPGTPDVAFCGARKRPEGRQYFWHEVDEASVCAMCLTYPGALEYAMGN